MTNNKDFSELYNQAWQNRIKLHRWEINGLKVRAVEGPGRRQNIDILNCRNFGAITMEGCVVVTHDHGVWVKFNSEQWFNPITNQDVLVHDLDILSYLIAEAEGGKVATIIDPVQ